MKINKGEPNMCKKLSEIHNKKPEDFLSEGFCIPVDIESILKKWEIDCFSVDFDLIQNTLPFAGSTITGLSYARNDDIIIFYEKNEDYKKNRFTMAHELAHCCLHMDVNSACHIELQTSKDFLYKSNRKLKIFNPKKEKEADKFARDLLIPTNPLIQILNKNLLNDINELAELFCVPIDVVQKKLEDIRVEMEAI